MKADSKRVFSEVQKQPLGRTIIKRTVQTSDSYVQQSKGVLRGLIDLPHFLQKNRDHQSCHFLSGDKGCQEEKEINSQLLEDSAAATEELLIRAKLSGNFPYHSTFVSYLETLVVSAHLLGAACLIRMEQTEPPELERARSDKGLQCSLQALRPKHFTLVKKGKEKLLCIWI